MWLRHVQGYARGTAAFAATAALTGSLVGAATVPAAADVISPFAQRYDESIYGDFKTIGNTVMGCPTGDATMAARCAVAANGEGKDNNNTFVMERINTAGTTDGYGSSTGRVAIPPGAKVAYARLFFGGNDGTYRGPSGAALKRCDISGADVLPSPGDPLAAVPVVGVAGATPTKVAPQNLVRDPATTSGPHYYTGEADVTSLFSGVTGTGAPVPVAVGDIWAPTGKGCVAGWSMTVVYKYDGPDETYAPDRRNVYVYGGHVLQRSTSPATTVTVDGFYRTSGTPHASVTAYEGDWNTSGDKFAVGGQNITESHTGNTNNFFISEDDGALDPKMVNNLSIDAKEFDVSGGSSRAAVKAEPIPVGATSTTLSFSTKGDTYVPSALALSVPVPDLEITKTASPATVRPGDTVTYTVKAENISKLDYPNAKFTDDLTENLDDATYNNDAKASVGNVSYTAPKINFTGDIPAGKTATVTYSVKVKDPVGGDGKLTNNIVADTPRTNCEDGSTDPKCGITPVIEEPPAPPTPPQLIVDVGEFPLNPPPGDLVVPVVIRNPGDTPRETEVTDEDGTLREVTVPPHGQITVPVHIEVPNTPGRTVTRHLVIPGSVCAKGSTDPSCTITFTVGRVQARPTPPKPTAPELAETGSDSHTLLYGGLAVSLCGLGALILAAVRSRRN
ncbi:isopeptide-forming domain-containing fimbrial protein [Streptomyces sp. NPDC052225]|uniref:isopeptide-forming domain-containing fimbrial protein n=1 Tax=Streptomyces sp. NPDC052225 TaxID=3154949 RepID=UPI00341446A5